LKSTANSATAVARNVRRIGHLDLAGAGQVTVQGNYAYVGHIPNRAHLGTTILDVSDPAHPRSMASITLTDTASHSHKVRVAGDLMIVNHERNPTAIGRRADELPRVRRQLGEALGRAPTHAELAQKLGVTEADIGEIENEAQRGYHNGGFKIYDISRPAQPREIVHHRTGGIGVHRFDMDEHYAYISTEMDGFIGNILVIYDIRNPQHPAEVSRWWMPGQHIAGGESPSWPGRQHRLHHALRYGDEMWASCWHGGFSILDVSKIAEPKCVGSYNYHPLFPEPTHTVRPLPMRHNGRRIALSIDEEDQAQSAGEEAVRRGRAHACILTFDVTEPGAIKPLAQFQVSEQDSPFSRMPGARFGAHQFAERSEGTLVHAAWFGGGLRIIDVADPLAPKEVGYFMPEPVGGRSAPQSNDVTLDDRGLIYLVDRYVGFDILECKLN
jgi:hypothetical protein